MQHRKRIAVAGYGAVGRALVDRLSRRGDEIIVAQRQKPAKLPVNTSFVKVNIEDENEASAALAGSDVVVCAVGIPYSKIYTSAWPVIMRNIIQACIQTHARFVFADNMYMYGPQTSPLTENMPLTDYGRKPRVRAEITKQWQEAHQKGLVKAVAVRASDFYGPDASTSVLSTYGVVRLLAGKAALAPYPPDNPHDFTYVPDFARAVETLIDAPDDAYGQAWHVPNAPTRTLRELMVQAAKLIGVQPRVSVLSQTLSAFLGLFRSDVREAKEMRFQWDRPYIVNTSKFSSRFWNNPTSFEEGLQATIEFYRNSRETHTAP